MLIELGELGPAEALLDALPPGDKQATEAQAVLARLGFATVAAESPDAEALERAIAADPSCAMAYWGKAYALGPNYNSQVMSPEASQEAYRARLAAEARSASCTSVEQDLIGTLAALHNLQMF